MQSVRCSSCNVVLAHRQKQFDAACVRRNEETTDVDPAFLAFNDLRYCCRRMLMTNVQIMERKSFAARAATHGTHVTNSLRQRSNLVLIPNLTIGLSQKTGETNDNSPGQ